MITEDSDETDVDAPGNKRVDKSGNCAVGEASEITESGWCLAVAMMTMMTMMIYI